MTLLLFLITYPWLTICTLAVFFLWLGKYIERAETNNTHPDTGPSLLLMQGFVFAIGTAIAVLGILYLLNQPGAVDSETLIQYTSNELTKNPAIENCVLTGLASTDEAITPRVVKSQIRTCNEQEAVNDNSAETDEQRKSRLLEALQNRSEES